MASYLICSRSRHCDDETNIYSTTLFKIMDGLPYQNRALLGHLMKLKTHNLFNQ